MLRGAVSCGAGEIRVRSKLGARCCRQESDAYTNVSGSADVGFAVNGASYFSSSLRIGSILSIRPPMGFETLHWRTSSLVAPVFRVLDRCLCFSCFLTLPSGRNISSAFSSSWSEPSVNASSKPLPWSTGSRMESCPSTTLGFFGLRFRFLRFRSASSSPPLLRLVAIAY